MDYKQLAYDTEKAELTTGDGLVTLRHTAEALGLDISEKLRTLRDEVGRIENKLQREILVQNPESYKALRDLSDYEYNHKSDLPLRTNYNALKKLLGRPGLEAEEYGNLKIHWYLVNRGSTEGFRISAHRDGKLKRENPDKDYTWKVSITKFTRKNHDQIIQDFTAWLRHHLES